MDIVFKKIIKIAIIIALLILIYGVIIQEKSIYIGFFGGIIISILNFYLLIRDTTISIQSRKAGIRTGVSGYIKRYLIYIVFLSIMMKIEFSCFLAGVIGLFVIKLVIICLQFLEYIKVGFQSKKK